MDARSSQARSSAARWLFTAMVIAALWGVSSPGLAAGQASPPPSQAPARTTASTDSSATTWGAAIDTDALARLRGGEASVAVVVDNQGTVGNNSANGVISGFNQIDDRAFANASGISTVIQNSGSNVLIQNGTAINVQFVDPGR